MRTAGITAALFVIAVASAAPPAMAQSQFCLPLQMELSALENPSRSLETDKPKLRQKLARARADAKRIGCSTRLSSRKRGKRSCRSALSRIDRLERQLSGSKRRGIFGFGRTPEERQRDRIRGAMARAGCAQTYRTICVRVCDGYYFPLSFAASRQRFAADAVKCLSQYELGEANLYYYPNPGGDVSQAVSLSGKRYFEQPYAFLFRSSFQRQCAVRLHDGLASLGERAVGNPSTPGRLFEAAVIARMSTQTVPIPIARVDWSSDPETLANRAGSLVPEPTSPQTTAIAVAGIGGATRKVGEAHYSAVANTGPPKTVAGYEPPELHDYRIRLKASSSPVAR